MDSQNNNPTSHGRKRSRSFTTGTYSQAWRGRERRQGIIPKALISLKADASTEECTLWERGTNENTNGLIRQYFPRNRNLRDVTSEEVRSAADRLNNRPRKKLGFRTTQ